jgi:uncharacterized protein YmfQ (DUF2313 family)
MDGVNEYQNRININRVRIARYRTHAKAANETLRNFEFLESLLEKMAGKCWLASFKR